MNIQELKKTANQVRKNIVTEVYYAKAGHPGGSLSSAEIYTYLYMEEMNVDPAKPADPDRDRFVLSKGHTCLQGHPSMHYLPGIDMSSGSLGQGISCAVGMALAAKLQGKAYRTYTLLGDGEIQEGQVWEAAMFAGAKKLDNLCVIVDNNNLQIDGTIVEVNNPYPIDKKFEAFNFHVINVENGHDFEQLAAAFAEARAIEGVPTAIICKTTKGKGVSFMENNVGWHGKAPNAEEYKTAMEDLERIGEAL